MGTAASAEPCVYERLWESIAVLRESGQRYGMSERDIERFITQVLQTNEPQVQDPPQDQDPDQEQGAEQHGLANGFPLLRATAKCALALCLLLVLGLGLSPPQSQSGPLSLGFNWTCPLGAARLLELPIARKYNLRGYRGWWGSGPLLQESSLNTSVCAEEPQPEVIKDGRWRLQRSDLEQLVQVHPDSVSVRTEDGLSLRSGLPQGPANFSLHWRPTGGAAELLPLLFPTAQPPLLDSGGAALRRCVVKTLRLSQLQRHGVPVQGLVLLTAGQASLSVSPVCPPKHDTSLQRTIRLQLRPGDSVFCDPRFWRTELFPGPDLTLFCDGSES